ncbi:MULTISPECIES: thioredoxin family protein [Psychromonas]|uniref:thioredoxin family protein n=1 Tax=Psychromonas TaxID=67572 RepID=UPI0004284B8D|nr:MULTISPECIES: thioredoxin family protein [Psychromonas]MBB1274542.1 thioredoxin family protein [Psychromonas sp. SR45-3]
MNINETGFAPDYQEETVTFEEISELTGDAIIEFGAPWCAHCQAAAGAIQQALTEHSLTAQSVLPHIKVYDGKGKKLGRAFKVKLWPTLILLRDGKEVDRLVRPLSADQVRQLILK